MFNGYSTDGYIIFFHSFSEKLFEKKASISLAGRSGKNYILTFKSTLRINQNEINHFSNSFIMCNAVGNYRHIGSATGN